MEYRMISHEDFQAAVKRLDLLTEKVEEDDGLDPHAFMKAWAEQEGVDAGAIEMSLHGLCQDVARAVMGDDAYDSMVEQAAKSQGLDLEERAAEGYLPPVPIEANTFKGLFSALMLGLEVGGSRVTDSDMPDLDFVKDKDEDQLSD